MVIYAQGETSLRKRFTEYILQNESRSRSGGPSVFFWFFRPHYPTVCYVPMEASPNAALPKLFLYTAFCFPRLLFPPVASVTPDA